MQALFRTICVDAYKSLVLTPRMDPTKTSIMPLGSPLERSLVESPVRPDAEYREKIEGDDRAAERAQREREAREDDEYRREHDRDYDEPQGEREMGESNWDRNH